MAVSIRFDPSGARGVELDRSVRQSAAQSLAVLGEPIVAEVPELRIPLERCIAVVRTRPVRPGLFALYSDLVESIFADDQSGFRSAIDALAAFDAEASDAVRGVTITDADLGAGIADRFLRQLDDDPSTPVCVTPISAAELGGANSCLAATWSLLDAAAPELADEIRALVRDVVFVGCEPGAGRLTFHGASTFYLWGALFLNASMHCDRVSMAIGLAHEAAHSLLFGYTLGAPLVDNDASERYASPLREEPRPMDGIVHATYVLARMHYCIERLLASGAVTAAERERLDEAKRRRRADYLQGLEIVAAHARLTPIGRSLLHGAQAYMAAAGTA